MQLQHKSAPQPQLSRKAQLLVECLDLPKATWIPDARWEPFQLKFLNNDTRYGIDSKARQIAWSWTAAADAVADSVLNPQTPHIFVSINLSEAKEKIRYARDIVYALDEAVRPKLVRDSQLELEFSNGSRLISHPCRPPRGKPRCRIYLDEMAHYKKGADREVYTAALPATTKGDGYMRLGSSPLGAGGQFWEIMTERTRSYPGYADHRHYLPWWTVQYLCNDIHAAYHAQVGQMPTATRVLQFGTTPLVEIFQNMLLDDFQQEYECAWVDESIAWISWDVIHANQLEDLTFFRASNTTAALTILQHLREAVNTQKIETALFGGIDIGRRRHVTEFVITGRDKSERLSMRALISLSNTKYDEQQALFAEYLRALPFQRVLIDRNGIGDQLTENLEMGFPGVVQGTVYSAGNKEAFAVEAKIQAERRNTPLPIDRSFAYQIHAIKRRPSQSKTTHFDVERNTKHHADQFWAWATSLYAAKTLYSVWTFAG